MRIHTKVANNTFISVDAKTYLTAKAVWAGMEHAQNKYDAENYEKIHLMITRTASAIDTANDLDAMTELLKDAVVLCKTKSLSGSQLDDEVKRIKNLIFKYGSREIDRANNPGSGKDFLKCVASAVAVSAVLFGFVAFAVSADSAPVPSNSSVTHVN